MGSRFKKSLVSENVRNSLQQWKKRVKTRSGSASSVAVVGATSHSSSVCTMDNDDDDDDDDEDGEVNDDFIANCSEGSTSNAAQSTRSSRVLQHASSDDTDIRISVRSSPPNVTSNDNRDEENERIIEGSDL